MQEWSLYKFQDLFHINNANVSLGFHLIHVLIGKLFVLMCLLKFVAKIICHNFTLTIAPLQ